MLLPVTADHGVLLDIRHATADNLTGQPIYARPVALLRRQAHAALELPAEAIRLRALLLGILAATGWAHIASEWRHDEIPGLAALPSLWATDAPAGPMDPQPRPR